MIFLRLANESDLPLMMAWRSNPLVYEGFYQQDKSLVWQEHLLWWHTRNRDWRTFIIMLQEGDGLRPIGVVTIGQLDHWSPEIGFYVGEVSLWTRGIGREAVRLGLEYIKAYGCEYAHTTILDSNERSIRLMRSLGFEVFGTARPGESWYQKKL